MLYESPAVIATLDCAEIADEAFGMDGIPHASH